MKKSISSACILFACMVFSLGNASANLIENGDFEQGNSGFYSDYTYGGTGETALWPAGTYSVVAQAQDVNMHFCSTGDHTTGSGLYFVGNGSSDATMAVWQTAFPIQVTESGTAYRFEAFITSVVQPYDHGPVLQFQVGNGDEWFNMGTTEAFPYTYTAGTWRLSYYDAVFNETGEYYLRLLNAQTASEGNDLGIDDIYFGLSSAAPSHGSNPVDQGETSTVTLSPVPEPTSGLLIGLVSICLLHSRRRDQNN